MAALDKADITATTLEGGLLQVAQMLQYVEQNYTLTEGTPRANRVNIAYNSETNLATVTATLPIMISTNPEGGVSMSATPYVPNV